MGYTDQCLWLDDPGAERDERIGEHEAYATLYDLANTRYLGNQVPWAESLGAFLNNGTDNPAWLGELLDTRLRVVPRCKCDPGWYGGAEWSGGRLKIARAEGGIDFEATHEATLAAWQEHVEAERAALADRHSAAAKRRGGHLIALDELARLSPADRIGAIRTARAALDAVEIETVIEERRQGHSWGEIGTQLGTSKQAARLRFLRYDPQGAEAA